MPFYVDWIAEWDCYEQGAAILLLKSPEPLGPGHSDSAELRFPFANAGITDTMFPAELCNRNHGLMSPKICLWYALLKNGCAPYRSFDWARTTIKLD